MCDSPGLGSHYDEFRSFPVYETLEHTQVSLLDEKMKELKEHIGVSSSSSSPSPLSLVGRGILSYSAGGSASENLLPHHSHPGSNRMQEHFCIGKDKEINHHNTIPLSQQHCDSFSLHTQWPSLIHRPPQHFYNLQHKVFCEGLGNQTSRARTSFLYLSGMYAQDTTLA